ncbi:TPA: type-F conjugative transfer system pilin assembly protein TrbC [Enterobacter hormaechei subsp. xiangfangensis]|uniref:type-F conjugative transfer system pilin assembly protein TrbC n=1 Tax=Enterobacter cloacae complex TaxID=354276 RepID=UPI001330DA12|nr:type-F conjugative transfer system pilin assembly protein TrbC [Enterobacter roggenkampii]MCM7653701.1 type-F conjugative transfer system pilin assembly protein TrbC [Enterobacter hormaechei]HCM9429390.1 type-F conjugative transfer system pilin assembly protein TrbC [Enterobacter hormaechei subsp. xiangfangensis]
MKNAFKTALLLAGVSMFTTVANASEQTTSLQNRDWMKQQLEAAEEFKEALRAADMNQFSSLVDKDLVRQLSEGMQRNQSGSADEKTFPAIYFVSLGIPEEGLLQMLGDANRLGVPATIRGWLNNDLRKTANRMFELSKKKKDIGVQIDPTLFEQYGITAVPALVVTCPGHFDVIRGSLPLQDMLQKVAEKGDCADTARWLMGAEK